MGFRKYRQQRSSKANLRYDNFDTHPCADCGKECAIRYERCFNCEMKRKGGNC